MDPQFFVDYAQDKFRELPIGSGLQFATLRVSAADFLTLGSKPIKMIYGIEDAAIIPILAVGVVKFGTTDWSDITNLELHLQIGDVDNTVDMNSLSTLVTWDGALLSTLADRCVGNLMSNWSGQLGPTGQPILYKGLDVSLVLFDINTGAKTDLIAGDSEFFCTVAYVVQPLI